MCLFTVNFFCLLTLNQLNHLHPHHYPLTISYITSYVPVPLLWQKQQLVIMPQKDCKIELVCDRRKAQPRLAMLAQLPGLQGAIPDPQWQKLGCGQPKAISFKMKFLRSQLSSSLP
mmetsp:Transcript_5007/g.9311  ORF Transcript_5007/g.9311 Transcript_5007/m.9311 type:complete len:116 (+) Transcript_5007:231-578(+)